MGSGHEGYSDQEGELLVTTARRAILEWLENKAKTAPPQGTPQKLFQEAGVFVTLTTRDHQLRGCIGYPLPTKPLIEATIEMAIEAATQDPRFPPVTLPEAEQDIVVEVSVLTQPTPLKASDPKEYPKHVQIGQDGLIVECGYAKGLLLPQVATEWKMDPEEFLSHCCLKAGLSPDNWLSPDVKVKKFQAMIFAEERPNGRIYRRTI